MIYSVLFLFLLPFQSMSTVDFIDTLSKTDSYSLHKLLYQNKLFCVYLAFTPNPECIIYQYHGYYIFWKNQNVFSCYYSESRLYHPSMSFIPISNIMYMELDMNLI